MAETEDFEALLAEFEHQQPGASKRRDPQVGDRVRGTVVSVGRQAVFVDLGAKSEGTIEIESITDDDGNVTLAVGDAVDATVVKKDDRSGVMVLRPVRARGGAQMAAGAAGIEELEQAFAHGLPVPGLVTGVNKGGVEVQIAGVRGFCPISQLDLRFVEDPESYVGRKFDFRITRYEVGRQLNLVVSRKALLQEEAQSRAAATRAKLVVGAVLPGEVISIKPYGAFIDLGGIEGMVHISELGFARVERPEDVLSVGQSVEVAVLKIEKTGDPKRPEKIGLSIRALSADPWDAVVERFPEGSRVRGTVVRLQQFGAFVELAPGVEGLIHISELGAGRRLSHPREVLKLGAAADVVVLGVDREQRRISLSMAAAAAQDEAAETQASVAAYRPPSQSLGTFGDLLKKKLGSDD